MANEMKWIAVSVVVACHGAPLPATTMAKSPPPPKDTTCDGRLTPPVGGNTDDESWMHAVVRPTTSLSVFHVVVLPWH
jgi:hypothetical protein